MGTILYSKTSLFPQNVNIWDPSREKMRLTEIERVSHSTAQNLYQAGYSTAESVAYGYGPDVTSVDSVSEKVYLNAQKLVAEKSNLSPEKALEQHKFWCSACEPDEYFGRVSFKSESACLQHMEACEDCPSGFGDLK